MWGQAGLSRLRILGGCIVLGVAVILLFCSYLALAEIEVTHDRFDGKTTIHTKAKGSLNRLAISLIGVFPTSPERPGIAIMLDGAFDSWRYLECHVTKWLLDDNPLTLPVPTHQGSAKSGYVIERLLITPVTMSHIERLAKAKKVEFKVCNDEYTATEEEMRDFRDFLSKMRTRGAKE